MKLKALALALLVAGFGCSYALAGTHQGHDKTAVCHKAGKSGHWVEISVATKAAQKAHVKHGDLLPDASGKCPAGTHRTGTTTDTTTTTTVATTTGETTTTETTSSDDGQGDDDNQGDDGQGQDGSGGDTSDS